MFSNGDAAIPSKGMGELASQLAKAIPAERIRYNSNVLNASGNQVSLDNGDVIECDRCILAAPTYSSLWKPYAVKDTNFIKTYVFYFSVLILQYLKTKNYTCFLAFRLWPITW